MEHDDVINRYQAVMQRVADAAARSGRKAQDVHVVAVSKYAGEQAVQALMRHGHCDFGESRAQQMVDRIAHLSSITPAHSAASTVRWHMIGHLQRNKIKQVAPLVDLIHSVDTLRLAEDLQTFNERHQRHSDILLQVNVSGEPQKHGVPQAAAVHLAEQLQELDHLRLRGLMMMAPYGEDVTRLRELFRRTRELHEEVRGRLGSSQVNILSMGMTDDFEPAIEEGANVVRIGRAIFGDESHHAD